MSILFRFSFLLSPAVWLSSWTVYFTIRYKNYFQYVQSWFCYSEPCLKKIIMSYQLLFKESIVMNTLSNTMQDTETCNKVLQLQKWNATVMQSFWVTGNEHQRNKMPGIPIRSYATRSYYFKTSSLCTKNSNCNKIKTASSFILAIWITVRKIL